MGAGGPRVCWEEVVQDFSDLPEPFCKDTLLDLPPS